MWTDPLADLRDIHLPEVGGWWPPSAGGWLLMLAAAGLLLLAGNRLYRLMPIWLARRRTRAAAMRALNDLRSQARQAATAASVASEIAVLLRRVAFSRHPRTAVAGLYGIEWLQFLDRHLPDADQSNGFCAGPGDLITSLPYQRPPPDSQPAPTSEAIEALEPLFTLAQRWIEHNAGPPVAVHKNKLTSVLTSRFSTKRLQIR